MNKVNIETMDGLQLNVRTTDPMTVTHQMLSGGLEVITVTIKHETNIHEKGS